MFIVALVESGLMPQQPNQPRQGPPAVIVSALLEAFSACILATVITLTAFGKAWRYGLRLWLNTAVRQARRGGGLAPAAGICGSGHKATPLVGGAPQVVFGGRALCPSNT